jgi:serine/threonine protein kinase
LRLNGSCSCHPRHGSQSKWLVTDFSFSAVNLNSDAFVVSYQGRGTPRYRAPELIRESNPSYCRRSDCWSIGCILFKVATTNARSAFSSDWDVTSFVLKPERPVPKLDATDNINLQRSTWCPVRRTSIPIWEQINDIFELCFTRDPEQRATAFELKKRFEGIWSSLTGNCARNGTKSLHQY